MDGHQMVILEVATRLYRRCMTPKERSRLDYYRKQFIKEMEASEVVTGQDHSILPGTSRIEFTHKRLIMLLDIAKLAQRERVLVNPHLDKVIKTLENANNDFARIGRT